MLVTRPAPNFKATAIMGDNTFKEISLSDYRGKKVVLFFYPLDFTFVCPTEILAFNSRLKEFEERGVQVLGCSVDSQWSHYAWKNTPLEKGGIGEIKYPLIADIDKSIARAYDVLQEVDEASVITDDAELETTVNGSAALRGTFLIDEEGIVWHATINAEPLGRNIDETLRYVDALAFHQEHGEVCPAGWVEGKDAMAENPAGVSAYLSEHAQEL